MVDVARFVSQDELKKWRKSLGSDRKKGWQRVSYTAPPRKGTPAALSPDGESAVMKAVAAHPQSPDKAYRQVVDHIMGNLFSDPERIRRMVAGLRQMRPEVQHMSDEQIVAWVRRDTEERLKESVRRVYHQTRREKELTIKTGGV